MVKIIAPASATVINGISMGKGSAFAISLYLTAEVNIIGFNTKDDIEITCIVDNKNINTDMMKIAVRYAYDALNKCDKFNLKNIQIEVKTKSDIPMASGLSSSSASSNAIVKATILALLEKTNLTMEAVNLTDDDILNIAIDASLEAKVTITGAYDDAIASYYGGLYITDNYKRKVIKHKQLKDNQKILIYIPNKNSHSGQADVKSMKLLAPLVKLAYKEAINDNITDALTLNGILYCTSLDFNTQITMKALKAGAYAAGLSGTGSAYIILSDNEYLGNIKEALSEYPGRIIEVSTDNTGLKRV
ncbi:MAG: shikimate kinase [Methanobacteriaceae archaeon]|nr:shikimate kinase [Methanobacteriaceae archaeon]